MTLMSPPPSPGFLLFRPSFWLILAYVVVFNFYVDAGLAFGASDKEIHLRHHSHNQKLNSSSQIPTWDHSYPPPDHNSSSQSHQSKLTWTNSLFLLAVMFFSSASSCFFSVELMAAQ